MKDKRRRVPDWVADIQYSIANIHSDMGGLSKAEFLADGKTQRAVIKGLIDIGEASKTIMTLDADASWSRLNPAVWQHFKDAYAMRIRLTHSYHSVDASVVFDTIKNHLPVFDALLKVSLKTAPPPDDSLPPSGGE
jgi:uncharacterized protein with HEPN domain